MDEIGRDGIGRFSLTTESEAIGETASSNPRSEAQVDNAFRTQVEPHNDGLAAANSFGRGRKRYTWERLLDLFKEEPQPNALRLAWNKPLIAIKFLDQCFHA